MYVYIYIHIYIYRISHGHPMSSHHPSFAGESTAGGGRPDGAAGAGDRGLPCLATCVELGSWVKSGG